MKIWNEYFLPVVRNRTHDYVLVWFADAVPPSNVITEYLKVFETHPDAGWVGGQCHRRYPKHEQLCSPKPRKAARINKIQKVAMTAHVWMNPREALAKCEFGRLTGVSDMHFSITRSLQEMGLYVYYQPSVYLSHVSTDGIIYQTESVKIEK